MTVEIGNKYIHSKNQTSKQWPQYMTVLIASMCSFAVGLQYAWSSPSYSKLLSPDYHLNLTSDEASYITVIYPIGDFVGAPLGAILSDVIGRKNGILLLALPVFISWMFIAFASNVSMLYIGRFIGGIGDGLLFTVYPMYVGEVTDPNVRGILGCSLTVAMILGIISINTYAPFLSIQNGALLSSIFPIILVLTFIWMPESPYYYLMKNQVEKARKSLVFLKRCDVEEDLKALQRDVARQMSERGTIKDLFYIESNRKALFITIGVRGIQQFSGISAWNFFTQTIFMEAGDFISPIVATLIYLCTQLTISTCGSVLLEKYGRKPLLIISSIGTGFVLIMGGIYFYLKEMTDIDVTSVSWLPIPIMLSFTVMYSIGLGTIPSLLLSELFSASIKGKALCVMCIYYAGMMSLTSKLFHFLTENFGMYASFFTFGCLCSSSVLFSYYFVPETKGKSLEDIQQHLKGNKKN